LCKSKHKVLHERPTSLGEKEKKLGILFKKMRKSFAGIKNRSNFAANFRTMKATNVILSLLAVILVKPE